MTVITGRPAEGALRRASLIADLHHLIDDLAVMDETGIPERLPYQIPVPEWLDHEQKRAWLNRVAAAWGVTPVDNAVGRRAEKQYGEVSLRVSVAHPGNGVFEHKARFAAMQASNGMGATA
jgi:hypothetical protein